MPSIINATTTGGVVVSGDNSGSLQLQNSGVTELTVASTGVTVADNLLFNSGYGSAAVAYGCRAWINFNGQGTIAIRGSGNITSIADNGTGEYTVTLTNAMPDANYAPVASDFFYGETITGVLTTTTFKVYTYNQGSPVDASSVFVAVFR
jgi:hypothetical protein